MGLELRLGFRYELVKVVGPNELLVGAIRYFEAVQNHKLFLIINVSGRML